MTHCVDKRAYRFTCLSEPFSARSLLGTVLIFRTSGLEGEAWSLPAKAICCIPVGMCFSPGTYLSLCLGISDDKEHPSQLCGTELIITHEEGGLVGRWGQWEGRAGIGGQVVERSLQARDSTCKGQKAQGVGEGVGQA